MAAFFIRILLALAPALMLPASNAICSALAAGAGAGGGQEGEGVEGDPDQGQLHAMNLTDSSDLCKSLPVTPRHKKRDYS